MSLKRRDDSVIAIWTIDVWGLDRHRSPEDSQVFTIRSAEFQGLSGDEMADLFAKRRDEALEYARNLMDPKRMTRVTIDFVWM